MTLESKLTEQLETQLQPFAEASNRIVLAFSGGLDSCVLLHLLATNLSNPKILLWHVNHGLQDSAAEMESFCLKLAEKYGVEIKVSHLNLGQYSSNVEAIARSARYAEFETGLGSQDVLLTAHHADDQAETFFLNLLRSAGSAGLRGIARIKTLANFRIIRPLLDFERSDLAEYAHQHNLKWFEDPSNQSDRYNRNYLRNNVIPVIKSRWPGFVQTIRSVCHIQAETQQLLDEIAGNDYQQCGVKSTDQPDRLDKQVLTSLSKARQKNLIRFWMRQNDCQSLPAGKLRELIKQLDAGRDAQPIIQAGDHDIRIFDQQLFIVEHQGDLQLKPRYDFSDDSGLSIKSIELKISREEILEQLKLTEQGQVLSIRFRSGSNPSNNAGHRLKHLFQKHRVPPWLRDQTPQVFIDDDLQGIYLNKTIEK